MRAFSNGDSSQLSPNAVAREHLAGRVQAPAPMPDAAAVGQARGEGHSAGATPDSYLLPAWHGAG
jgi:hypothetical protein